MAFDSSAAYSIVQTDSGQELYEQGGTYYKRFSPYDAVSPPLQYNQQYDSSVAVSAVAGMGSYFIYPSGDVSGSSDTAAINARSGTSFTLGAGTYYVTSLTLGDDTQIITYGDGPLLQQVSGQAEGTRIVNVVGSRVTVGNIRLKGNIATDTNEQQHGLLVLSSSGDISSIKIGNVYGENIRGDVVSIDGRAAKKVTNVKVGRVVGVNVYRNVVSITGGRDIEIEDIRGATCGCMVFDCEPNSVSQEVRGVKVGNIKAGSIQFASYQTTVLVGSVQIGKCDLDPAYQANSTPTYSAYSVAAGVTTRGVDGLSIGALIANNYGSFVLENKWTSGDSTSRGLSIDRLESSNINQSESTYNCHILASKVDDIRIGGGVSSVTNTNEFLILGDSGAPTSLRLDISNFVIDNTLARYFAYSRFSGLKISTTNGGDLLRNGSYSTISRSDITMPYILNGCTNMSVMDSNIVSSGYLSNGSPKVSYAINSTLGGSYVSAGAVA